MTIQTGDVVTVAFTGRLEDGTVFDTTRPSVAEETGMAAAQPDREFGPLTVEVGDEQVLEGFEDALLGLTAGDSETVSLDPEAAYGEWHETQVREYDADEFAERLGGQQPEEGAFIERQDGSLAEIVHADDETVRVDFNHRLAGETVVFDLEVIDVR
ncbi:MAG: FKBP-type peptidyl-prolyl cis-trans isomerase [Halobacteriales archaeon]